MNQRTQRAPLLLLSALAGMAVFILIYGYRILSPAYTDWLMVFGHGDPQQHFLGWRFFRQSAWHFPIGLMDNLGYPFLTSIVYTDSIPIFAVIFKLLSPILPDPFQYFGLWGILCYALQGALGALLCLKYARSNTQAFLGSLLFILSPIVLNRMFYHSALAGQWIILLGLLFVVYHSTLEQRPVRAILAWGGLGALIGSIHLYFLPMCGILCLGYCAFDIFRNKRWYGILPVVSLVLFAVGASWLFGAFSTPASASLDGLGRYSFNLNSFVNPLGYEHSAILRNLPTYGDGQHEGLAYLGFGVIILCVVSLALCVESYLRRSDDRYSLRDDLRQNRLSLIIFAAMSVVCLIVAVSPTVTFNDRALFTVPLPSRLLNIWAIFRSSGRLIWPVNYMILLGAIALLTGRQNRRFAVLILACCVGLQAYDLSLQMRGLHKQYSQRVQYENPLDLDFWDDLGNDGEIRHLITHDDLQEYLYPLSDVALRNHWTVNDFYFARSIDGIWKTFGNSIEAPEDDMLFVIRAPRFAEIAMHADTRISFYDAGDLVIGSTQQGLISLPQVTLESLAYPIGSNENVRGGEDIDGVRYIHPDGLSYGPYWNLRPGIYSIRVVGTDLDRARIQCTTDHAAQTLTTYDYLDSPTEVSFTIQVLETARDLEVLVQPTGAKTVSLSSITLTFVSDNSEILADDPVRSHRQIAYSYVFEGDANLEGGMDEGGVRYLDAGSGNSYGPYISVSSGTYTVRITGTGLDRASFDCVSDSGSIVHYLTDVSVSPEEISYRVILREPVLDMETRVRNPSDKMISITSLTIDSEQPEEE